VFRLAFDGAVAPAGTLQPTTSADAGVPPEFVPGVDGQALVLQDKPKRGWALLFARGFPAARGSVALWVSPLDWSYTDARFHMFLSAAFYPPDTPLAALDEKTQHSNYLLYKYAMPFGAPLLWLYAGTRPGQPADKFSLGLTAADMTDWLPGTWHQLVLTWNAADKYPRCQLFVDGESIGMTSSEWNRFDFSGQARLLLGASWGGEGRTAVDEFALYDVCLSEDDVGAAYAGVKERLAQRGRDK
jgi:hypothetical protein